MTLNDLQESHPSGVYSKRHGCYYFVDYDSELGYFIEMNNGSFEKQPNWVDLDTLGEKLRDELELIAAHISFNK